MGKEKFHLRQPSKNSVFLLGNDIDYQICVCLSYQSKALKKFQGYSKGLLSSVNCESLLACHNCRSSAAQ